MYPGMQFVVAGIVTKPMAFYEVPALRMALELIVHLFILTVYTVVVLEEHNGPITLAEIVLTVHVVVSASRDQYNVRTVYCSKYQTLPGGEFQSLMFPKDISRPYFFTDASPSPSFTVSPLSETNAFEIGPRGCVILHVTSYTGTPCDACYGDVCDATGWRNFMS